MLSYNKECKTCATYIYLIELMKREPERSCCFVVKPDECPCLNCIVKGICKQKDKCDKYLKSYRGGKNANL